LYDLVKIKDDKLRPAFMYAMQNTLVADSLDQAARISYNSDRRFKRVVTLQVRACVSLCVQGHTCLFKRHVLASFCLKHMC
jgi:hypothetical protein